MTADTMSKDESIRLMQAEIERLREENALLTKGWQPATPTALLAEIERLRAAFNLREEDHREKTAEIERLRGLLREARDDVAECMGQETKPHRIKANKVRLAAIDQAIGE